MRENGDECISLWEGQKGKWNVRNQATLINRLIGRDLFCTSLSWILQL